MTSSDQRLARPQKPPSVPRWRQILRRVLTTGIKVVCFVEAVHYLSDRSAKRQGNKNSWDDGSDFSEGDSESEEEGEDKVMDLLVNYVNGMYMDPMHDVDHNQCW
jgi:hypothetical protein